MQEYQVIKLSSKRFESVNYYYCIIIELRAKRNFSLDLKIPLAMRLARTAAMRVEQRVRRCRCGTSVQRVHCMYAILPFTFKKMYSSCLGERMI